MADKELVYGVRLDAAQAQAQAAQLRALFQQELQSLSFSLLDPGTLSSALSSTQAIRAQYQQIAQDAQAATQALQNAGSSSATQTRAAYDQIAQDAAAAARSMQQAAAQKPQAPIGGGRPTGGLGGLGNAVLGGVAGYFTVQGAQMIARQATEFAELGTQVRRTETSFRILSGGAAQAELSLNAIREASGGAITDLKAMDLANQAISLHLADTAQGLGDVTRSAREIALVSPTIHDMGEALSQLGLFAANPQSFARADQLGLSATEVKDRMKELQAANSGLDDSQAKLQASMQLLDEKFGTLLTTTEAQASGVEKLKVAFSNLWAEMAKGPVGTGIDAAIGKIADSDLLATGRKKEISELDNAITNLQKKANAPFGGSGAAGAVDFFTQIKADVIEANKAIDDGVPGAQEYKNSLLQIAQTGVDSFGQVTEAAKTSLDALEKAQKITAGNAAYGAKFLDPSAVNAYADNFLKARQDRVSGDLEPITKLGNSLKDIGVDNFFQSIQDGLAKSAELTANETNKVAELRQELTQIAKDTADNDGNATESARQRVAAINTQIDALTQAAKLNKELQTGSGSAPNQDLPAIYERLNTIIAQTSGIMDGVANSARQLGDAIAQSGSASADQMAQLADLAAQANQADFSTVANSLQELNSASLDAVPGVSGLRDELTGLYDALASGQGLTDAQAATLAGLAVQADALGGSTSALAGIQQALGYKFLESDTYAAGLVGQIATLEALYGGGKIGADQFAGGMAGLTASLYAQLDAAGALTPKLRELLALLGAVGSAKVAPGQVGGGIYTGQGPAPGLSPSFVAGQRQAEAAAAIARSKADSIARSEALAAQKKAASGAQSAFEHAASATEKAFKDVADKITQALEKVPGLLSNSKVTAEDMAATKAGTYVPKADELRRQVDSAAENPADRNRFASQIQAAKEALNKIGVKASDDIKVLAQQLDAAWNDSSLFANKDNLKLINADAVKASIDLQTKAKEGRQNILDYFGATIDGVKAQFKAGNPEIVGAVAAELGASNDKNLQAMADQLKSGGQQIIDKVLSLAQASIDKAVGSLGSGASTGSAGGGITVPTVNVGAAGAPTDGAGGFLAGTPFAGGTVPVTAQITEILPSATPLAPISVTAQVSSVDASKANVESAKTSLIERLVLLLSPTIDVSKTDTATARTTLVERMPLTLTPWIDTSKANTKTARDLLIEQMPLHLTPFITTASVDTETARTSLVERLPLALTPFIDTKLVDVSTARTELIEKLALPLNPTIDVSKTSVESAKTSLIERMVLSLNPIVDVTRTDVTAARTTLIEKMAVVVNPQVDASKTDVAAARTALIEKLALPLNPSIDISKTDVETAKTSLIEKMVLQLNPQIDTSKTDVETAKTALTERMVVVVNPQVDASKTDVSTARTLLIEKLALPLTPYIDTSNIAGKIQEAISKASSDVEQEGADGKIRKKSALDFTATASQIASSLSKAMGGQTAVLSGIGDTASAYIGFGMTDHDFGTTASTLISSMTTSFTTEQARTQLIAAGSALSGAIFAGFESSLAFQPWVSSIVAIVVSQAVTSLNDSLQDGLKSQALGF